MANNSFILSMFLPRSPLSISITNSKKESGLPPRPSMACVDCNEVHRIDKNSSHQGHHGLPETWIPSFLTHLEDWWQKTLEVLNESILRIIYRI